MPDFRLDRLSSSERIIDNNGLPSMALQRRIQKAWEKIEEAYTDLSTQLAAIVAAQAAATAAQTTATAATREAARLASYPNPGSVLSAADVGADRA